jgi:hypothetical protein
MAARLSAQGKGRIFKMSNFPKETKVVFIVDGTLDQVFWDLVAEMNWAAAGWFRVDSLKQTIISRYGAVAAGQLSDYLWKQINEVKLAIRNDMTNAPWHEYNLTDNGIHDLSSHVVGLGRATFMGILADTMAARKMARDCAFREGFASIFPNPRDYDILNPAYYSAGATRLLDQIREEIAQKEKQGWRNALLDEAHEVVKRILAPLADGMLADALDDDTEGRMKLAMETIRELGLNIGFGAENLISSLRRSLPNM